MFPGEKTNLQSTLLQQISQNPGVSAAWLHARILHGRRCSIQAVYKELRHLLGKGVVVKNRNVFSLSLSWIVTHLNFLDSAYDRLMQNFSCSLAGPDGPARQTWQFTDLRRTDDFMVQSMLTLLEQTGKKRMLQWIPQPWYELIQHEKEIRFQNALRALGCKAHVIFGGESYLYQHLSRNWSRDVYDFVLSAEFMPSERSKAIGVIGDYVLTVKLDSATTDLLDRYFTETSGPDDMSVGRFVSILNGRIRSSITLENSPARAAKLKRQFCRFLGLNAGDF